MKKILLALFLSMTGLAQAQDPVILVLGDSLSAAYGIDTGRGWVQLLEQRLETTQYRFRIVNASISGDTTRSALARIDALLAKHRPGILIIGLGGNDGLRGISLSEMKKNLEELVSRAQQQGARVLLLGMRLPPNYGKFYTGRFHQIYHEVAGDRNAALVAFFLEGVAQDFGLMQADGIHPTAEAQPLLLENVWPGLEPLLTAADTSAPNGTQDVAKNGGSTPSGDSDRPAVYQ